MTETKKIKFLEPIECPGGVHNRIRSRPVGPPDENGMVPTELYCEDCNEVVVGWKSKVPVPITFDIVAAKEKILVYQDEVNKMFKEAEGIIVDSDATNKDATEVGTTAMALYKKIKEIKKNVPHYIDAKEFVEKVEAFEKILTEKLYDPSGKKKTIVSIMKAKLSQYTSKLESDRRIQQALADNAQVELQNNLNKQAEKTGTVAPVVSPVIIPKKDTTVRTESGSSYAVHKWTHEITDLLQVPIKYLQRAANPNISKQGAAALKSVLDDEVKNGVRDPGIPGVHIFENVTTSFKK